MLSPREKRYVPNKHLSLLLEKPTVPGSIRERARTENLPEKEEVHISVIVSKNAKRLWLALSKYENRPELYSSVESLFRSFDWEYELTDEYFLHERFYSITMLEESGDEGPLHEHMRRSIVQKVILPDLIPFYTQLNELSGANLPVPVPHITLFALGGRGIGINSTEDFKQFTKEVLEV